MSKRRVVITGMGIISPVGNKLEEAWQNICAGNSGIRRIEDFDVSDYATQIAGTIVDFDVADYISKREARRMDVFMHYGIAASVDAIHDSGSPAKPIPVSSAIGLFHVVMSPRLN